MHVSLQIHVCVCWCMFVNVSHFSWMCKSATCFHRSLLYVRVVSREVLVQTAQTDAGALFSCCRSLFIPTAGHFCMFVLIGSLRIRIHLCLFLLGAQILCCRLRRKVGLGSLWDHRKKIRRRAGIKTGHDSTEKCV